MFTKPGRVTLPDNAPLRVGQIVSGPLFNEPMRVETVRPNGPETRVAGMVGLCSESSRSVTPTQRDLETLTIWETSATSDGDAHLVRLGLQAYTLGIACEFDRSFGLSVSGVDPLPHQLEAVYDHLLKLPRVGFMLADDGTMLQKLELNALARPIRVREPKPPPSGRS